VASGLWLATLMVVFLFSWLLLNLPDWMRGVDALLGLALVLWIWWVGVYTHSRPIVSFATYVNLALIFMVFLFQVLVIAIGVQMAKREGRVIDARRNFFGISGVERVHSPTDGFYKEIFNGRIGHGRQYEREDLAQEVNLYYGPGSGVGLALNYHPKVGVIGLGTGTLAAWGRQGDEFIYYEINPAVIDLAEEHFSYFENSLADCETRLGDARILLEQTLRENRPENFDVLIVDAFSSDAIPRHLLTREAMAVYAQHLADGGVIAIHISNWFLRLDPVVFGIAEDAGFQAVNIYHEVLDSQRFHSSDWMLVSKDQEFLNQPIIHDSEYQGPELKRILWTDDFGSVLQVMKVKRPEYWPIEWWPFYYK
jgi:hypothetical protein